MQLYSILWVWVYRWECEVDVSVSVCVQIIHIANNFIEWNTALFFLVFYKEMFII